MKQERIPSVDLHNLFNIEQVNENDPNIQGIAENFGKALHEYGFAYLSNHGIPEDMISTVFEESAQFFQLPSEIKMLYAKKDIVQNYHGYTPPGIEQLNHVNRELKETFDFFGNERFYPKEVPKFHEVCETLETVSWKLQIKLLKLLAMSIKVDNVNVFNENMRALSDPTIPTLNVLRSAYYPPIGEDVRPGDIRCAPHTDYGTMTMLFQDDMGGLEVKTKSNTWIPAPPISGTIIINTGDLLEKWTCGYFPATHHRVVIPECEVKMKKSRQSLAAFSHPDNDVIVYPLRSEMLDKDYNFEPINTFEHVFGKAKKAYGVAV